MNYDEARRQYHIGLAPGDVARRILFAGDPTRVRRFSENLDSIRGEWTCREYLTITGTWKNEEVSLMATGIGASNIEIAMVELSKIVDDPILRSCGIMWRNRCRYPPWRSGCQLGSGSHGKHVDHFCP